MRSQLLLRRSRTFVKIATHPHRAISSSTYIDRYPGRNLRPHVRSTKRNLSSSSSTNPSDAPPPPPQNPSDATPEEGADGDKPKRRTKASVQKDSDQLPQLPPSLDILWTPRNSRTGSPVLPPPEMFEEILDNLHVTLHPRTQHKATYASAEGFPIEPTFALCCPIEGGDYIIDETIKELAHRTSSDVVILDAVQLAAGESGVFGKAATAVQLPENPLHFPTSATTPEAKVAEDDEEPSIISQLQFPSQMRVHLLAPSGSRSSPDSQKSTSKSKAFFDELVNISPLPSESGQTPRRPRLIYIRDFPTLAASSSTWYPALLAAVRQRRAGPIARTSSPVPNPMTIIFGLTPPITPSAASSNPSSSGPVKDLVNPQVGGHVSDNAREHRLRERLKKWEKGSIHLLEELPGLVTGSDEVEGSSRPNGRVGMGFLTSNLPLPPFLNEIIERRIVFSEETEPGSSFYRHSVVVPSVRSIDQERACRMARRREINELTMRMAIASVGGLLQPLDCSVSSPKAGDNGTPTEDCRDDVKMWENWSRDITDWSTVRQIADRAVGSVVDTVLRESNNTLKLTLDPTLITWSAVAHAWVAQKSIKDVKRTWLNNLSPHEDSAKLWSGSEDEEIIGKVRQGTVLDPYEERLLRCIVDSRSLTTTFAQVHLPSHTIDSVRTIVSLPLLHPEAFRHGILKEHGITGCLLFGPPGTGKTLIVRALAKEAGCRMLTIAPSNVMDMYVGEGEKLVKAVFSLARKLSPCVVFIDEIDSLFGARSSPHEARGAFAQRGVITEFMSEMDGLRSSVKDRVIVVGATNRPFDLDDAVLRRMPRRLLIDLPEEKERAEILKILLREEVISPDVNLSILAKKTGNFSGSDLKHLCVSAALDAIKGQISLPWSTSKGSAKPSCPPEISVNTSNSFTKSHSKNSSGSEGQGASEVRSSFESNPAPATVEAEMMPAPARILSMANFAKALKEITPSSSEALSTLGELRKWNDEFGEGGKEKKRQMWGKGSFGFVDKGDKHEGIKIGAVVDPSTP